MPLSSSQLINIPFNRPKQPGSNPLATEASHANQKEADQGQNTIKQGFLVIQDQSDPNCKHWPDKKLHQGFTSSLKHNFQLTLRNSGNFLSMFCYTGLKLNFLARLQLNTAEKESRLMETLSFHSFETRGKGCVTFVNNVAMSQNSNLKI